MNLTVAFAEYSKKKNGTYHALVIRIGDREFKRVFLDDNETELLELKEVPKEDHKED